MKGIILAGGSGSRLYPITRGVNKQLLPVYNKPMIYYPLSILMLAGIREILVISSPQALPQFEGMLGDGAQWGLSITYLPQHAPNGLAEAFIIGEDFIRDDNVCLVLGDNIFYGSTLPKRLRKAGEMKSGAVLFAYQVKDPTKYAVLEIEEDENGTKTAKGLEEKPQDPASHYAIPGLYFYDNQVIEYAKSIKPSKRGELEITDINKIYLEQKAVEIIYLGRGIAWLDVGTHESLLQAANFIQVVEDRQGLMISCVEEIAYRLNYISKTDLEKLINKMGNNQYQAYLETLL